MTVVRSDGSATRTVFGADGSVLEPPVEEPSSDEELEAVQVDGTAALLLDAERARREAHDGVIESGPPSVELAIEANLAGADAYAAYLTINSQ